MCFWHFVMIDCHDSSLFNKSLESRNDKNAIFSNDKNNRLPHSFHSLAMTEVESLLTMTAVESKIPTPQTPSAREGKFGNSANGGGQKAKYFAKYGNFYRHCENFHCCHCEQLDSAFSQNLMRGNLFIKFAKCVFLAFCNDRLPRF